MRILALDVGARRIGMALSDPSGTLATPLGFLARRSLGQDVDAIVRRVTDSSVKLVLVGMPLTLRGERGRQAQLVEEFCRALTDVIKVEVVVWDERYSTAEAESRMREAGGKPSRERGRADAAAAAVILQSYLDKNRSEAPCD